MKRYLSLLIAMLCVIALFQSCEEEPEKLGSIYGIITDKATGEPVKNANVQLRPSGETSLTGSDGRYEFRELKHGDYSITVSKTGYIDLIDDYVITVNSEKAMCRDVQIEKLPAALRIVDDKGNDISELDYGSHVDDVSRLINVFNDGMSVLQYKVHKTASWIESLSSVEDSLNPGMTKPIVINIERSLLSVGDNTTTLHVTSDYGSKELIVKAHRLGNIITLDPMNITLTSATLMGSVNKDVSYSEKGFKFWSDSNNSVNYKVEGTNSGEFFYQISNLVEGTTYYYRAYMVCNDELVYGEQKSFTTSSSVHKPEVTTKDITDKTQTTAKSGGVVTSNGGAEVTARGVCWSTSPSPEIDDNHTTDGTGEGAFESEITGLTSNTIYYVRAYAINSEGTSYGDEKTFTTLSTVITYPVTDVTHETAVSGGYVVEIGDAAVTSRGVCWSTSQNPTISDNHTTDGSGEGEFTSNVTGLMPNTTYYLRAYATNEGGTGYGEEYSFTTERYQIGGYDCVDLGLPSGLKWATCNIGASSPEEYGNYYAWGETEPKSTYTEYNSITYGEQMGDISGDPEYDAATANWGSTWRMPTEEECEELVDECTWQWTTQNGVNGYKVIGPNGNHIFLPAAGCRDGSSLDSAGETGRYWSSTPYSNGYRAYHLRFYSSDYSVYYYNRYSGRSVRPVSE